MQVRDICTREVVSIRSHATLIDAAETMRRCHVGALVVCDQADSLWVPIGMLTDRDIVVSAVAAGLAVETLRVKDVMTKPAVVCRGTDHVFEAIGVMRRHAIRRLPVVDRNGSLEGIVTANDVWRAAADQLGRLGDVMTNARVREMRRRA